MDFHDITLGDDTLAGAPVQGFAAGRGYDLVTGMGAPDAAHRCRERYLPGQRLYLAEAEPETALKDALSHLQSVTVEVGGKRAELWLRVPPAGFELPLLPSPSTPRSEARRIRTLALVLRGRVESLDGEPLSRERAHGFAAHPGSVAAPSRLRAELYDGERFEGRVYLACPHCANESELSLVAFAIALGPAGASLQTEVGGGPHCPQRPELPRRNTETSDAGFRMRRS